MNMNQPRREMTEGEALAFALGLLAGYRDQHRHTGLGSVAGMALEALRRVFVSDESLRAGR